MYVPNPQKWMKYYESMAKGYHNPYVDQKGGQRKQIGGSLSGNRGTFMVPIEEIPHSTNSLSSNPVKVNLVSPSQQVVEQAKSELQIARKGIKRKRASKSVSSSKRRRTVRSLNKTSRKNKPKKTKKNKVTVKKTNLRKNRKTNLKRGGKNSRRKLNKKKTQFSDIFT